MVSPREHAAHTALNTGWDVYMPLYTITTQVGVLDNAAKAIFADRLTAFHSELSSVPKNWVHVIFHEYSLGCGFTAGRPSSTAALTVLIRTGRSAEYKREMLKQLWSLLQAATGAPDQEIVLGIQEVPPSQAMEMGQIMPDVAGH
jgi:phenylpyruvate tautomerase PptA (4-oxalocrotonate tautomerase family)